MYDYFYGQQAELFSFYRVPKVLFTDEKFSNISSDAKLLYGIMLDRMNLSAKNGWVDELGRVYIIFTIEEVKGALGCAEKKAVKLLHELENKCGLIERKRIGLGKPNYIYVKNFVDNSVERQFLNCQKDNSGTVNKTLQELSKAQGNNTDIKDTDYSDTDPILSSDFSGRDVEKDEEFQSYIRGFEADIQTVTAHPQIAEGFCGMEILGKHYIEKEDAGEMILAACKEMKGTEPIPLGSYRGFQMELSFDSFRHDFDITLKGAVSHRVSLGTDARGNIIRLDNALSSIPEKLEKSHEQLTNLQNQQEATRAELGKPFPQEAELAEKSARLAELDAALNMEDSMPEHEEAEQADKPSVLADLKAKSEHIPPYRASGGREEVL